MNELDKELASSWVCDLYVPPEWEEIDFDLQGTIMVIGGPDTGKSTFSSFMYQRLRSLGRPVAYLDGDPGQTRLGPPTAMALSFSSDDPGIRLCFVGSSSPSGHMLPLLVGAAKLAQKAYEAGARTLVFDTTGLIDRSSGGLHLKLAKINLLRPSLLFAFQQDRELEPLLRPLRLSKRLGIIDLKPSAAVKVRSREERRAYRAARLARYFREARPMWVDWSGLAVFPYTRFSLNRLVALEDKEGFTLGLGIVMAAQREKSVLLLTPVSSLAEVNALNLGDMLVDPVHFIDSSDPLR